MTGEDDKDFEQYQALDLKIAKALQIDVPELLSIVQEARSLAQDGEQDTQGQGLDHRGGQCRAERAGGQAAQGGRGYLSTGFKAWIIALKTLGLPATRLPLSR